MHRAQHISQRNSSNYGVPKLGVGKLLQRLRPGHKQRHRSVDRVYGYASRDQIGPQPRPNLPTIGRRR